MLRCSPAAATPAMDFGFSVLLLYALVLRIIVNNLFTLHGF